MQQNKTLIWGTLVLTLTLSVVALMLPIPVDWPTNNVGFHQQLITSIIMAGTHTGGAILFLTNLGVYKAKLRRAYITLAIGTLITGAGTLQISILIIFNAWNNPYAQSGATALPFLLSGVVLYMAVRSFARLIGVKHILTKASIGLLSAALFALATSLLPHAYDPRTPEIAYDFVVGISAWSGSLILLAGWLAFSVKQHIGAHYTRAMTWLTRALIFSAFVLLYQGFYTLVTVGYNPALSAVSSIAIVVSGLTWVRAGYAFALTKYYTETIPLLRLLFSQLEMDTASRPKTIVDMVTYAAGLVSNSQDIDPMLDKVRSITAKLKPGEAPSAKDRSSLVETYLKIEQYLTTKEPIRSYTQKEIRAQLNPSLEKLLSGHGSNTT